MKNVRNLTTLLLAMLLFASCSNVENKNSNNKPVKVTRDNFIKAETAHYFKKVVDKVGVNKFLYYPGIGSEDNQIVVRTNRDVLYAQGIFCVKGGLTITTPKADRLIIVQILDENHYDLGSVFSGETRTITEKDVSEGKFVQLTIRVGVKYDKNGKPDLDKANEVMHAIKAETKCNEPYNPPLYDPKGLDSLRAVLTAEFNADPNKYTSKDGFGGIGYRDTPEGLEAANMFVAIGWGGLTYNDAFYAMFNGKGDTEITFDKPDLDYEHGGFYSLTIYSKDGWIRSKEFSIGSERIVPNKDGTITIHVVAEGTDLSKFKNAVEYDPQVDNGEWTATFRLYKPKKGKADEVMQWGLDLAKKYDVKLKND